jgi:hypothetical protein
MALGAPVANTRGDLQDLANGSGRALALHAAQRVANDSVRVQEHARLATLPGHAAPPPASFTRGGLPGALQSQLEQLSGYAMDDVAVHYNSSKPAQLRAHAYTEGTDIFVAPGQERHLVHEAWHVVQQKQGRVRATMRENGVAINDDPGLEHEADQMGANALRLGVRQPARQLASAPVRASPPQRKVVQRLTSQVVMDEERKIRHVVVRGRPPRMHGSRMGDHSTAFIVHVEGLNIALAGLTIPQAIERIHVLDRHIVDLLRGQGSEAPAVLAEIDQFNGLVAQAILSLEIDGSMDMATHYLQLAINSYLRAREMVPFSTINVAAVSPGLAGKGHGESRHAALLSMAERGQAPGIAKGDLIKAISGLFDAQAAGLVAVETDPGMVAALVGQPVPNERRGALQRLNVIWQQHLLSIQAMFPKCFAQVKDELPVEAHEDVLIRLDILNLEWGLNEGGLRLGEARRSMQNLLRELAGRTAGLPQYRGKLNMTKLGEIAPLYRMLAGVDRSMAGLARIDQRLGRQHHGRIAALQREASELRKQLATLPTYDVAREEGTALATARHLSGKFSEQQKPEYGHSLGHLHTIMQGLPSSPGELVYPSTPTYTPYADEDEAASQVSTTMEEEVQPDATTDADTASGQEPDVDELDPLQDAPLGTLTAGAASMSIQLMVRLLDGQVRIEGMLSSGRPPSPFSGSMGAHSTAWIVHLDRVRTRLMGSTLAQGVRTMQTMIAETTSLAETLNRHTLGDNASKLIEGARSRLDRANAQTPERATIDALQEMIGAMLSYLNLLPTISQDYIKTTGNAEGVWRRVLLDYEYANIGSAKAVQEAIKELFDSKQGSLRERHRTFIQQAYPRAAALAAGKPVPPLSGPQPISNEQDDFSSDAGTTEKLDQSQVEAMRREYTDKNYLDRGSMAGINNCLFDAIADAAGIPPPSVDEVIRLREVLNVPLGTMLTATRGRLDIILTAMGLDDRGAMVFYQGEGWTDSSSEVSNNPLFIQHDGVNHFTAAFRAQPQQDKK